MEPANSSTGAPLVMIPTTADKSTAGTPTPEPNNPPPEPTMPSHTSIAEMQSQIEALRRQLSETENKLLTSNRQCQQLQAELQLPLPALPSGSSSSTSSLYQGLSITSAASPGTSSSSTVTQSSNSQQNQPPLTHVSNPNLTNLYTNPTTSFAASAPLIATSTAAMLMLPSHLPTNSSATPTQAAHLAENVNAYQLPPSSSAVPLLYGAATYTQNTPSYNNFTAAAYSRKLYDLPEFSGEPEEWPIFFTAYMQTTAAYNYTNFENNQRILKCLKGEAREVVKSLLIHPDNVSAAIDQLRFRFGRPEQLIHSQLRNVRELQCISENNLAKIVPFATKIKNLSVFLQSVNGQQHIANPTLLEELVMKLPMSKRLEWAGKAASIQPYATIVHFSDWISDVANLICTVQDMEQKEPKRRVLLNTSERQPQCPVCKAQHRLFECTQFQKFNVNERWSQVKKIRACFSCLNLGHSSRDCRRKRICGNNGCRRSHHKLLHENECSGTVIENQRSQAESPQKVLSCTSATNQSDKLLFRVLPVTLFGNNCRMTIYALFDDGSSITMLDKSIADKLGVSGRRSNLKVQRFGGHSAQEEVSSFNIAVSGATKEKRYILRNVYAVSNLNLPTQSLTKEEIEDAFKSTNAPVTPYSNVVPLLLIGLDHAHLGLPKNIMINSLSSPIASNTKLGWVVYGPCRTLSPNSNSCLFVNVNADNSLFELVDNYFNIESIGVKTAEPIESASDIRAQKILEETTKRVGGRYQTGLLWKSDSVTLPDNYNMAYKRLEGIENKMFRNPEFAAAYRDVLNGYVDKGYVRRLSSQDINHNSNRKWYLPHFGVINPNKPKKVRLVFDAAAQTDGISLNSFLLKGPQDIASLPSILFNFRRGKVAVSADIREMFHQVLVQPKDRISQRFLWRDCNREELPAEYEMVVMTFGAACSPCSARHVMKVNASDHKNIHPRAFKAIIKHHYIYDFVDSFATTEEAIETSEQVRAIHKNGGFELRGFTSNCKKVIAALEGDVTPKKLFSHEGLEKVLGVYWDSSSDTFKFHLKFNNVNPSVVSGEKCPTKRELLSIIMSTFDPLGFLSMYTVAGKLLLREVWRRDCRWDEKIPDDLNHSWNQWRMQMDKISIFFVPRCYFSSGMPNHIHLHIFVDASQDAFAAVAYWRSEWSDGKTDVQFITSKTKCTPLKIVSVPRLELQAAVLGTRLRQSILDGHEIIPEKCILWSDSKTVLKWIGSSHRRYKPYVAHRVAEILESTEVDNWKWIPTDANVADDATRSNNNVNFSPASRWLNGPLFLKQSEDKWFKNITSNDSRDDQNDDDEELRQKSCLIIVSDALIDFKRFSSFSRIKRTMAWVLRFINNSRKRSCITTQHGLTARELESAENVLILLAQSEGFPEEISLIKNGKAIPKKSNLTQLTPYLDEEGLLRVYGRIDAASFLPFSTRRPIILPSNNVLTLLVVRHYHCQMKHLYYEATICEIRKRFWIPQVRRLLNRVVSNCMVCRCIKSSPSVPFMGSLPRDRIEAYSRPFKNTGLDYFGPLTVSVGRRSEKRWVALFTCLTVRAIHLEIAHDLSTDSCIIAMRNFMNRRGVPARIRSDNGKNFVGANEEAKRFSEVFEAGRIQDELSAKGVEWIFNCPVNPSEGGVWERMVQCVKRVLRQTLKEVSPKEHVLQSLLIEAENIVNSRPLTHLPIDPNEKEPLTPNHFLVGYGNISQCADEPDTKLCAFRKQWRMVKALRDQFWKRWVLEYLPTLTRRVKWCERSVPIKEGDVVFICDPNLARSQWRRGIVVHVYCGADGVARRAEVNTSSGVVQRPVSRLAVLDVVDGEAEGSTGEGVLQITL